MDRIEGAQCRGPSFACSSHLDMLPAGRACRGLCFLIWIFVQPGIEQPFAWPIPPCAFPLFFRPRLVSPGGLLRPLPGVLPSLCAVAQTHQFVDQVSSRDPRAWQRNNHSVWHLLLL